MPTCNQPAFLSIQRILYWTPTSSILFFFLPYVSYSYYYYFIINSRSPTSYLANPAEERALYPEGDTDKNMTLIKIVDANNAGLGSIAWVLSLLFLLFSSSSSLFNYYLKFPVHCTSMNNSNHLISSDNKGYASYLLEKHMAANSSILFRDIPFVAAFGQAYNHHFMNNNIIIIID